MYLDIYFYYYKIVYLKKYTYHCSYDMCTSSVSLNDIDNRYLKDLLYINIKITFENTVSFII